MNNRLLKDIYYRCLFKAYKYRYIKHLKNIKSKLVEGHQINVCFLVNEITKWKAQSLYDMMEVDPNFAPFVGLTFADIDWELPYESRAKKRKDLILFFESHNIRYYETCLEPEENFFKFDEIKADIVFYQQPWNLHKMQAPDYLSKKALLCYFPYYVPNYSLISNDCRIDFHYKLWKYFQINKSWADYLSAVVSEKKGVVDIVATGHPMLDYINSKKNDIRKKGKSVIYSPHWSVYSDIFDNKERYSTFQHNGREILAYAQKHPEINWFFKPHPTLKSSLIRTGLMSEKEVNDYYAQWSNIGTVCEGGDYSELFWNSTALITDCGSFLVEYPSTGNPIIHLISSTCGASVPKPSKILFDSFYQVHSLDEMYECFEVVVNKGLDPLRDNRMKAIREAGLFETKAAGNIMDHLYECFNLQIR